MLKSKIKQNERVNKMELSETFRKNMQIAEDLNEIIITSNVVVASRWNNNS